MQKPIIILGQGALTEADGAALLAHVQKMCAPSGSKLLVLHTAAGRVGAMDVGAVTRRAGNGRRGSRGRM